MSKELKDLIDTIDSSNRAHSDLSKMINFLKDEVQRLTFTINEQKRVIQSQSAKLSSLKEDNLPKDVVILKEMFLSQKEELIKKDKDIEILKKTLEDITLELEESKIFKEENEELIYAQKTIVQLTEENEILNQKINKLQKIIASRNDDAFIDRDQQLIDAKKLLFQLTEENGIKSVKIEALKAENQDLKSKLEDRAHLNENLNNDLEHNIQSNKELMLQLKESQEKIKYLSQKLEKISNQRYEKTDIVQKQEEIKRLEELISNFNEEKLSLKNIIQKNSDMIENLRNQNAELSKELEHRDINEQKQKFENERTLEDLSNKLVRTQIINQELNDLINELREKESQSRGVAQQDLSTIINMTRNVPPSFFRIIYDLLDDDNKLKVKDILIKDLRSTSREERTYAIKILSTIQDSDVLNELKSMKSDEDWIVRLYLIKALSHFEKEKVKDTLELLIKDKDPDVRESADKLLSRYNQV